MNLETAIKRKQRFLIIKAKKIGLYENFGQTEVRRLEEQFIDISSYTSEMNKKRNLIQNFNNWCMNFDLQSLTI